jgi:glycosyltransferase involved in cell wall biosynthesis
MNGNHPLDRPLRVHMTGSEWFGSVAGGLNRYFESLFLALSGRQDVDVTAQAFGVPVGRGESWGSHTMGTLARIRTSRTPYPLPPGAILDRHFGLYSPRRGDSILVSHFQGPWAEESRVAGESDFKVRVKYLVERLAHARVERFIVLANAFRQMLIERYRVRENRVVVIPPGVDLDRFRVVGRPDTSDPVVLCVRRLERRMGIGVLLDAWREIASNAGGVKLVIIGSGSEEGALRQQSDALGLRDTVHFAGRVSDEQLASFYARSLFTVVPTIALEGFGLIALESLASGRAPIVTNCGGLPDSVRDLDQSLIVETGDAKALAQRMHAALEGDVPSPSACRAHAESFSWGTVADRHVHLYRQLTHV